MQTITVKNIEEIAPYSGANAIPGIRFRPARSALGVSSWGMNVIELDARCEGYPEHDHASDGHEEVYVVLRGTVILVVDGVERALSEGDMAHVPGSVKRKLITREHAATVLALGGTPGKPYGPSLGG
ncbi:hypothetical protein BH09MYX1_BH09MYX1_23410 [soil metagenome]